MTTGLPAMAKLRDGMEDRPVVWGALWRALSQIDGKINKLHAGSLQAVGDFIQARIHLSACRREVGLDEIRQHVQALEAKSGKPERAWMTSDERIKAADAMLKKNHKAIEEATKAAESAGSESDQTLYLVRKVANGE